VNKYFHSLAQHIADTRCQPKSTHLCAVSTTSGKVEEYDLSGLSNPKTTNNPPPSRPLYSYHGQDHNVTCLVLSPNNQTIASLTSTGDVVIWDVETKEVVASYQSDEDMSLACLAFSSDSSRLYCGGSNKSTNQPEVIIIETQYGELIERLGFDPTTTDNSIASLAVSSCSKLVAAGLGNGKGGVEVWIKGGKPFDLILHIYL